MSGLIEAISQEGKKNSTSDSSVNYPEQLTLRLSRTNNQISKDSIHA